MISEDKLIKVTPKSKSKRNREYEYVDGEFRRVNDTIERNSFLEPFDAKKFRRLNAVPPLGFGTVSRLGQ